MAQSSSSEPPERRDPFIMGEELLERVQQLAEKINRRLTDLIDYERSRPTPSIDPDPTDDYPALPSQFDGSDPSHAQVGR